MYLRDGAAYVITASNAGRQRNPGWYYNLRSNPQVSMQAHHMHMRAVAEIADSEKRKELWAQLIERAPMYAGYEKHTPREIPMVILRPVAPSEEQIAR
jgi:deazaflavin-dependent oxidoreductase (nitroreductase family)